MTNFHIPVFDTSKEDLLSISNYDIEGKYLIDLWNTNELDFDINKFNFYIDNKYNPKSDIIANPLSLLIFSDRIINIIKPLIKNDVKLVDINIVNDKNGEFVKGYKLIHPLKSISCLNKDKSNISLDEEGNLSLLGNCTLDKNKIDDKINIFRLKEDDSTIIFSDNLAKSLIGKEIYGLAFLRCKTT